MPSLLDQLRREPFEFDFFAAMRVLERSQRARKPLGGEAAPADEVVRLRTHLSMSFPPSQIAELLPPDDERPMPLMTTTFLGLYGVTGVLPTHYTQLMMDLVRDVRGPERRALRDFLDLFNHRLLSLFHRGWEKYRFFVPYERGPHDGDTFTLALRSIVGLGTKGLKDRLQVLGPSRIDESARWGEAATTAPVLGKIDDLALLCYAGFFAQRPRNASNLRALLADYFGLPVEVQPLRGQWLAIPANRQTQLGLGGCLGVDTVAGERVWNVESRFRIVLGALRYAQFTNLLPDRDPHPARKLFFLVAQMVRLFAGPEAEFDVQLVLAAKEIPPAHLGDDDSPGPRLGWNMWLVSQPAEVDSGDAVFEGEWVVSVQ